MADMEEILERQERERRARMRRRAASKRAQRELDEQIGVAVALLEEENQTQRGSREGRGPNVDRHRHSRADGIYLRWTTFVKSIPHPRSHKQKFFAAHQEGYRKDVERCFGILQARWAIIRGAARLFDEEVLRSIMMTCIILHNMIVEDEYD
ncbi:unnamed protein product, partial [Prunus brigantina]